MLQLAQMSNAQFVVARRAYHYHKIPDEGPGVLPPLTQVQKNALVGISKDLLRASFKAASFIFSRGSSAYRGVSWKKDEKKWRAQHQHTTVGYYDTEEEAARAYDRAALAKDRHTPFHILFKHI